ncbi:taste receptor type 1 member 1-like [Gymnodraco acuticeps]|uniref:Taste receptor type 1 member 1-like n=1 Tax=Gymnodraco acuticeps TaxID=8218 RepID=A0A6P8U368_GYMAC|nr:taste receptor type 1 member 1-like [Gymnodraco acuticeps]
MRFAVDEINNSTNLLPNVSLGYEIFDHCSSTQSFPDVVKLLSVNNLVQPWDEPHNNLSRILGVVSYAATVSVFSKKAVFPSFLRTVHSNKIAIEGIVNILKHFNWRWVAFLNSDDDYGNDGLALFMKKIKDTEICLAYNKGLNQYTDHSQTFKQIEAQKINIIIVFALKMTAEALIKSAIQLNFTNKVWIADEEWSLNKNLPKIKGIRNVGTVIGISEQAVNVPGVNDFIYSSRRQTYCENASQNIYCNQFFNRSSLSTEDVVAADPSFNFPVYTAVYAIAHALHNALQCESGRCNDNITVFPHMRSNGHLNILYPHQVLAELKKSNFTLLNESIRFDENGDPNYGSYSVVFWNHSEDAYRCIDCKETEWSAAGSTSCNLRSVEYIPFTDTGAILIMVGAWALVGFTLAVSVLFAINYNTPVVRSAGGPMCFLILVCLSLCSISVFFYFGEPTTSFCILSLYSFLLWYFIPKCYIIIFQSDRNTHEYFQRLIQNYTKTISQ